MHQPASRVLRVLLVCAVAVLGTSACVYRINVQQGNFLDPKALEQVQPGMTRSQVRLLLGTPIAASSFDEDRWDYVYYLKRGRDRHVEKRNVTVFFEGDKVTRVDRPEGELAQSAPVDPKIDVKDAAAAAAAERRGSAEPPSDPP
jgi:outer membrane protein assembly factor BamE